MVLKNFYQDARPLSDIYKVKGKIFTANYFPMRMLICAPSGSGKSNLVANMAVDHVVWDTLTVFCENSNQHIFKVLANYLRDTYAKSGNNPDEYIHFSNTIDKTLEEFNPELANLVIFDDMTTKSNMPLIEEYFRNGRNKNISIINICQNYCKSNQNIRDNVNILITAKPANTCHAAMIRAKYGNDLTRVVFDEVVQIATKSTVLQDPEAFLICFENEPDLSKKFRRCLDECGILTSDGNINPKYKQSNIVKKKNPMIEIDDEFLYNDFDSASDNDNDSEYDDVRYVAPIKRCTRKY